MRKILGVLKSQKGISTLITTLFIAPVLLFFCFCIVPFLVFHMKYEKLLTVTNQTLKEAEAVGHVNNTVIQNANAKLSAIGMSSVVINGVTYPNYSGSTTTKVMRNGTNPTVVVQIKYPAPNLSRVLLALGGSGSSSENEGFFVITLYGRSEAYN
ncbi:hypothetical protein [Paenibacillus sp. GXUN7292]|uniref:hypothetical protein n=1 Tax=Paenibacillus sp. GXUN7292 TaxID=3422499 RepID=UPI003D7F1481